MPASGTFIPGITLVVMSTVLILVLAQNDTENVRLPEPDEVSHVKFQTGKYDTVDSYMDNSTGFPTLTKFSLCVHIKYHHMALNNTLLSYFASGQDNELSFFTNSMDANTLQLYCCGDRVRNYLYYPIRMYTWEHLCVTVNLETKLITVVLNNDVREYTVQETKSDGNETKPLVIRGGGRLVLGQDLDSADGGFNIEQILPCEIADFAIYDVVLTLDEIRSFMACDNQIPYEPILYIDQQMSVLKAVGETAVSYIPEEEICATSSGYKLMFPERVTFWGNVAWCQMLKGTVILPKNEKENTEVYDKFFPYREECTDRWRTFYYFGTVRNVTTDKWFHYKDKSPIVYQKFDVQWNKIVSQYECAAVGNHLFKYTWFAIPCSSAMCSACNFTSSPRLRVRGLCDTSILDRAYYLNDYYNRRPLFDGEVHSRIFWSNNIWELRSRRHEDLSATMETKNSKVYPLGRHTWTIAGDKCTESKITLLMTPCSSDEYTCSTGSCIRKTSRCDLVIDCPDQSDELNCDVVNVPEGYSSTLPPPKITKDPLALAFSLRIITIRKFNLVGFSLVVDAVMSIKWRDSRLTFRNLRRNYRVNKVKDMYQLWTPKILVRDGSRSAADVQLRSEAVYVILEDSPLPDDITIVSEDDRYSGSNNTLVMETESTLEFTCQFQLQMYPVDRQNCFLLFTLPGLSKDFGLLIKDEDGVTFEGSRYLLEYELVGETLTEEMEGRFSLMQIRLEFRNLYGYYIGNTFVPSLFLVIIVYLTLYFDINDFEDRVMVSLTSLLVLATFFTQTSSSIPRTSYLKLIDAWYVALICQNFLVIVSLVVVENLRLRDKPMTTRVTPMGVKSYEGDEVLLYKKVNFFLKFVFPLMLFGILTSFFSFWSRN